MIAQNARKNAMIAQNARKNVATAQNARKNVATAQNKIKKMPFQNEMAFFFIKTILFLDIDLYEYLFVIFPLHLQIEVPE